MSDSNQCLLQAKAAANAVMEDYNRSKQERGGIGFWASLNGDVSAMQMNPLINVPEDFATHMAEGHGLSVFNACMEKGTRR